MSSKTHLKGSMVFGSSIDAASYIWSNWISGGQLSPPCSRFNVHVIPGTSTALAVVWATGSAGTGVFATGLFNTGGQLATGCFYSFTQLALASMFCNFQPVATTTMKLFVVDETFDW